jgi:hypothetical protein
MADTDHRRHSLGKDAGLIAGGMAPVLISWGLAQRVIPNFATVLASFGIDLPWSTRFVLHYYPYSFVLALLIIVVWWLWPRSQTRGLAALVCGIGLAAALWCTFIYSLYTPILSLGASVG